MRADRESHGHADRSSIGGTDDEPVARSLRGAKPLTDDEPDGEPLARSLRGADPLTDDDPDGKPECITDGHPVTKPDGHPVQQPVRLSDPGPHRRTDRDADVGTHDARLHKYDYGGLLHAHLREKTGLRRCVRPEQHALQRDQQKVGLHVQVRRGLHVYKGLR